MSNTRNLVSYDIGLGGDMANPKVDRVVHHQGRLESAQGTTARRVFGAFHRPRFGCSVVTVVEDVWVGVLREQVQAENTLIRNSISNYFSGVF